VCYFSRVSHQKNEFGKPVHNLKRNKFSNKNHHNEEEVAWPHGPAISLHLMTPRPVMHKQGMVYSLDASGLKTIALLVGTKRRRNIAPNPKYPFCCEAETDEKNLFFWLLSNDSNLILSVK
jgi:hypothetical protein